jgi:ketosteroid isomerase-like protein
MQQIWDGWGKLDASKQAQYYAQGEHTFFDIAPLKYGSWDEYQAGVTKELAGYKAANFAVNDDVQSHSAGDIVWGTATVKYDMTTTAGKHEMGNMRWTYVFGKQDGKWVLIHEHVSMPLQ